MKKLIKKLYLLINRNAIRKGLLELTHDGVIESVPGMGYFSGEDFDELLHEARTGAPMPRHWRITLMRLGEVWGV